MKKSFLILSLLALTFIACPPPEPEPQPEPEKPTLSKIDITDAAALFVEPSGTDAGKIFKIKKDLTTIEEVKYTNTDGSSADMGNLKASYVINAHNDYAIIGFAADPNKAKTYDFELVADKAYLVRKSDGKVFSLDEYGYPSCDAVMASGKYIYYPVGEINKNSSTNPADDSNTIYLYGDNLIRIDVTGTTPTGKNILPENIDSVSRFFIDKNDTVFFNSINSLNYITVDSVFGKYGDLALRMYFLGYIFETNSSALFTNGFDIDYIQFTSSAADFFNSKMMDMQINDPISIYEMNSQNIAVYNNAFTISMQLETPDEYGSDYTIDVPDYFEKTDFSVDESLFPATDGTSICIAEKSNSESETTFLLYNTETKQFNTIFYQGIQNSIIFRNDTMIASGILNDQNVITKKKTDFYSVVYLKVSNASPKEKIILVDMEYQGWKSLPFYTKE